MRNASWAVYRSGRMPFLWTRFDEIAIPIDGLRIGEQLSWLSEGQAKMKKTILAVALCSISIAANYAHAAPKKMPIDFIGEWCSPEKDGDTTTYTLPSWTEDHKCTEILSIDQWSFVFNMGGEKEIYCDPESIRTKQDTAPSGTAYFATISASCHYGTTPDRNSRRTYEFERYKGRLIIKSK